MNVTIRTSFTSYLRILALLIAVLLLSSLLAACGEDTPVPSLTSNSTAVPAATATSATPTLTSTTPVSATAIPVTKAAPTATADKKIDPATIAPTAPVTAISANPIVNITVQPGKPTEFKLKIGQAAVVQANNMQIKFSRVVSDARCANCTYSGPIALEMVVTQNGQTLDTFTLSDRKNDKYKLSEDIQGYTLTLVIVQPNRCGGCNEIKPEEYVASFGLGLS